MRDEEQGRVVKSSVLLILAIEFVAVPAVTLGSQFVCVMVRNITKFLHFTHTTIQRETTYYINSTNNIYHTRNNSVRKEKRKKYLFTDTTCGS